MNFRLFYISVIILTLSSLNSAQLFSPEYGFSPYCDISKDVELVGHFISKDEIHFASFSNYSEFAEVQIRNELNAIPDLFILDSMQIGVARKIQSNKGDGKDAILFYARSTKKNDHRINIYYYKPSKIKPNNYKVIFSLIDDDVISGDAFRYYSFQDIPELRNLVIIHFADGFPNNSSYRGILGFDLNSEKVIWETKIAHQLSSSSIVKNTDNKQSIVLAGNAVDNYFAAYKNHFYNFSDSAELNNFNFDKNDPTYFDDSRPIIFEINPFNGQIIKKKIFGNPLDYTLIISSNFDDNKNYLLLRHRAEKDIEGAAFYSLDLDSFALAKIINFNNSLGLFSFTGNKLTYFDDKFIYKVSLANEKIDSVKNSFTLITDGINYMNSREFSNYFMAFDETDQKYIIDIDSKKVCEINFDNALNYFPEFGFFTKVLDRKNLFYKLTPLSFWNRFTQYTLLSFLIGLLVLLVVILVLWGYTMIISRNRILEQKNSLEETTAKLIQSEKLAVLGTVAGGVAHELNSPLGAIINSGQRLLESQPSLKENDNFNLILKASAKAKNIAEKFLLSTRGTASKYAESDLNEVFNDVMQIYERQFSLLGISINKEIKINKFLKIDYTKLNQIITNLLINSKDAVLEKNKSEKLISIIAYEKDFFCIFEIIDNGTGFKEQILDNKFKAFITTKEIGKGTGLGLWVIKKILDQCGGNIEIGNYNSGARVIIRIPVSNTERNYDKGKGSA